MAHRAHAAFSPVEAQTDAAASAETRATELMPEAVELKPNGPAAAAILGAAMAVFSLGVMFVWSHSWGDLAEWLVFREQVGSVSGLSTMAGVIWISTWALLTPPLWKRNVPFLWLTAIAGVLIAAGLLLTWPPIAQRIEF
ncbi:MAG: hypothetical protein A2V88_15845 [Elusimicrobia bacterium RBG_16_66_12]|nr:MAG: hypothetical protein A2V88_15845 [Elusimicrobia bacterium RBG_16_66_12]